MHPIYTYIRKELSGFYPDAEVSAMAKSLLTDVFHLSALDLYAGKDSDFSSENLRRLDDILCRLKSFEPLQYIVGETGFYGFSFLVSPSVLIPRPETAELIDWISSDFKGISGVRILDIGTGSGCISISLASVMEDAHVSAWDISGEALLVAGKNSELNGVNVSFSKVDVLGEDIPDMTVDVIVSNPPYIGESEKKDMEANVIDWEPGLALFVPDDKPLVFYERIAFLGLRLLGDNGKLYFEINQLYGLETVEMLHRMGYVNVELRKDMSGNDRMIKAERP